VLPCTCHSHSCQIFSILPLLTQNNHQQDHVKMNKPLDPSPILQTAFGFWHSKVLLTAVEMGLFTKRRCDRLVCDRGDLEIRVSYVTFGPPWCDIHEGGRFVRRIKVDSEFTTSQALAQLSLEKFRAMQSGPRSVRTLVGMPRASSVELALIEKHEQEIAVWCERLLKTLEDEKIAA